MESYAAGETEPALLEETIAASFDRTVGAHPDREALVEVATGRRWTYRELNHEVDLFARGLIAGGIVKGDRVGVWAPNCAEWTIAQYATAKIGAILVNVNPAYRTHEFSYAVNQSGLRLLIAAESFKTSDYRAMVEETAPECPGLERVVFIGTSDWADVVAAGEKVDSDVVNERMRTLRSRRPDQHPVHVGHHRLSQGRDAVAPQHPQQRLPGHRADQLHRGRPAVHPGALLPLLRDGDGQPRLHLPRRDDGDPGAGLRPRGDAAGDRRRAVHRRLRRADDVHRDAEPPDVRRPRPVLAAHRDHGGLALPGRGDEALHRRHAHGGGLHRLRHDRDLAGLLPDPRRRRPRPPYRRPSAGPTRTSRSRSSTRRPARPSSADEPGEFCTRGYSVMLGYWEEARSKTARGHRRRRLDAHRRPGRDARGRLLQHRRPDQGHGHPRRREHLPARDRGVPLPAPRHRGRPGDRRPRREVRRGARAPGSR